MKLLSDLVRTTAEALRGVVGPLTAATAAVRRPAQWATDRLDRAMTCPACGHGPLDDMAERAEVAEACDCTDPLCECNDDAVDFGKDPR